MQMSPLRTMQKMDKEPKKFGPGGNLKEKSYRKSLNL